jgi:hypothetical protein
MENRKRTEDRAGKAPSRWERPSLTYVGNVGDVFLFPGAGKISTATYDSGDTPYKPKGQDPH